SMVSPVLLLGAGLRRRPRGLDPPLAPLEVLDRLEQRRRLRRGQVALLLEALERSAAERRAVVGLRLGLPLAALRLARAALVVAAPLVGLGAATLPRVLVLARPPAARRLARRQELAPLLFQAPERHLQV